jgi:hypothetical protein
MSRFFEIPDKADKAEDAPRREPGQRLALLIGNSRYPGGRLKNPIGDASLLETVLEGIGFEVTLLKDATKAAMERAIVDFGARLERAGQDSVAFFYYAGHGIQHEGQNYLVPIDADVPELRYLKSDTVPVGYLLDELEKAPYCACAVVLDACRNNPLASSSGREARGAPLQGLAPVQRVPAGTLMAYSTAAGAIAVDYDPRNKDNSPYAALLARRLPEPGELLREIFHGVAEEMRTLTRGEQNPFMAVQVFPSIVLVRKPEPPPLQVDTPAAGGNGVPAPPPQPSRLRRAALGAAAAVLAVAGAAVAPDSWVDYLPRPIADGALPAIRALPGIRSLPGVAEPMPLIKLNVLLADLARDDGRAMTDIVDDELYRQLRAGRDDSSISVRRLGTAMPCKSNEYTPCRSPPRGRPGAG